jgi:hypothetical protein
LFHAQPIGQCFHSLLPAAFLTPLPEIVINHRPGRNPAALWQAAPLAAGFTHVDQGGKQYTRTVFAFTVNGQKICYLFSLGIGEVERKRHDQDVF